MLGSGTTAAGFFVGGGLMVTADELVTRIRADLDALRSMVPDPSPPPPPPPPPPDPTPTPAPTNEHEAVMALVPASEATLFVPAGQIREITGDETHVGARIDGHIKLLSGTLAIDTLLIAHGTFEVPAGATATILIRDTGPITDPFRLGRGIVFHGRGLIAGNLTIRSESTALDRRGHVMVMTKDFEVSGNLTIIDCGRTDKSRPVTDMPDVTNLRGRYPLHIHKQGFTKPIKLANVTVKGSPGWGIVNHSSWVECDGCVTEDIFGAHMVGEAGDEIGHFRNGTHLRSTGAPGGISEDRGNFDFGWQGHGIWIHGGGIEVTGNTCEGHPGGDIAVMGRPGVKGAEFPVSNLRPDVLAQIDTTRWLGASAGHMAVQDVPFKVSGNRCLSASSLELYEIHNPHYHNARSLLEANEFRGRVSLGYVGHMDCVRNKHVGTGPYGISHTNRNFSMRYEHIEIDGFDVGMMAPNEHTSEVIGGKFNCLVAFQIGQKFSHDSPRLLLFDGMQEFGPKTIAGWHMSLRGLVNFRWNEDDAIAGRMPGEVFDLLFRGGPETVWNQPIMPNDEVRVGDFNLTYDCLAPTYHWRTPGLPFDGKTTADLIASGRRPGDVTLPDGWEVRTGHVGVFS